jgi:hypothetical protein
MSLAVVLVLQGCATTPPGGGRWALHRGTSVPGEPLEKESPVRRGPVSKGEEWEALAGARRAEVESTLRQVWGVAQGVEDMGARLEFTFWVEGGALTLMAWKRTAPGMEAGAPTSEEAFARGLRNLLVLLTEQRTGALVLTLYRERSGWRTQYEAVTVEAPPEEARAWPERRGGYSAETLTAVHGMARQVVRLLRVPAGGSARQRVEVRLEDDRLTGWEPGTYEASQGGSARLADAQVAEALTLAVLPFTRGLGPRTVRLEVVGRHVDSSNTSRWHVEQVEQAETLRPEPLPAEVEDAVREYRELHAYIFRQYREEMVDVVVLAGTFTLEEVALWVLGGVVGKGLHVLFKAVAPTVVRMFARGSESVRWLRTLLIRAGPQDQRLLRRLWVKAETQGFEALTVAERSELTALMGRLEKTLVTPLDKDAKDLLRKHARKSFYDSHPSELSRVLIDANGDRYDIHHVIPLEHAHLLPEVDINALVYLKAAADPVHSSISKVWASFSRSLDSKVKPEQVMKMVDVVDHHYHRWYNQFFDGTKVSQDALFRSEQAALHDVERLVVQWKQQGR